MNGLQGILTLLFATCVASAARGQGTSLIAPGATWRYLDDGTNPGTAWPSPEFSDTGWSGPAPAKLGYGEGDEATLVDFGPDANNKYRTTYFRKTVHVPDGSLMQWLEMELLRDDGAVVYVNGSEVWRENMPGVSDWQTFASSIVDGSDESRFWHRSTPVAGLMVDGDNVFAVEVHQVNAYSSDISFDFSCEAFTNEIPPTVVRGPYLQHGSPTGMVVCWRTDIATDSWVCFGDAPGNLDTVVVIPGVTTEHAVPLTGLLPGTTYTYAIGDTEYIFEGDDTDHQFTTHPMPGLIRAVRIWVLGDSGQVGTGARDVRDAFYTWSGSTEPDLWLMLGDNAYPNGTDAEYQGAVFDMYPSTLRESVVWPTLGNHDGHTAFSVDESGPYYAIFHLPEEGEAGGEPSLTEAWYSFDYANIHFICLNSYDVDRTTNGAMYAWLQVDLAQVTADWIMAFWHHPPYSKGSHDSDTSSALVDMRQVFLPLLEGAGVDLVLGGHSHSYERSMFVHGHYGLSTNLTGAMVVDGGSGRGDATGPIYDKTSTNAAVYAVAGSSSKLSGGPLNHPVMYLSLNLLGSLVIDIHSNRLDATFLGSSPTVLDTFSIEKTVDAYDLSTALEGVGSVVPAGGAFSAGSEVALWAEPGPYHGFSLWQDDLVGTNNPGSVTLNANRMVTAVFDAITVTNGVPTWWLALNGLDLTDAAALEDPDGDTVSTWKEWVADTGPTNGLSRLHLSGVEVGDPPAVHFDSTSTSRTYDVEFRDAGGPWQVLTHDMAGTGGPASVEDSSFSEDRAYRVRVHGP